MEEKHQRVLSWFSVRMKDEISDKEIGIWRPELRGSFVELEKNGVLKKTGQGYALTHAARSQINKYKAKGWPSFEV